MKTEEMQNVGEILEAMNFRYQYREETQTINLAMSSQIGTYGLTFDAHGGRVLKVSGAMNLVVPEGSRTDIALAVARANYGMMVGFFDFNVDMGDLRFRYLISLANGAPSRDQLDYAMAMVLFLLDRYVPAFMSIIYANTPAKEAISSAECVAA